MTWTPTTWRERLGWVATLVAISAEAHARRLKRALRRVGR